MTTPEGPIGSESGVTVGLVLTLVTGFVGVVLWFFALLQSYVRRDVLDVTMKSIDDRLERIEEELKNGTRGKHADRS